MRLCGFAGAGPLRRAMQKACMKATTNHTRARRALSVRAARSVTRILLALCLLRAQPRHEPRGRGAA